MITVNLSNRKMGKNFECAAKRSVEKFLCGAKRNTESYNVEFQKSKIFCSANGPGLFGWSLKGRKIEGKKCTASE